METEGLLKWLQERATGGILSQMNPVHITSYFIQIRVKIILPSTLRSRKL